MANSTTLEKRQLPRLLCSDKVSQCCVELNSHRYIAQTIDYNCYGIGLFCSDRFPEIEHCQISFSYQATDNLIKIDKLPCIVARSSETEVGNQYGIKFQIPLPDRAVEVKLAKIESLLKEEKKDGDRYGLFS